MNMNLYTQTHVGTKRVVEELIVEITESLGWLMDVQPDDLTPRRSKRNRRKVSSRGRVGPLMVSVYAGGDLCGLLECAGCVCDGV